MNVKRIEAAIKLFEKIPDANFSLSRWASDMRKEKIEETIECGTICCVGGWIASSKEFRKAGGSAHIFGTPLFDYSRGAHAIGKYLDIPQKQADQLCGFNRLGNQYDKMSVIPIYGKRYKYVKPSDVVRVLEGFLKKAE